MCWRFTKLLTFFSRSLSHSNEGGKYKDQTCMMGFSFNITGGPRMCFNAHKNWILGWYSDRQIQIDPDSQPFQGRLLAFTDAGGAASGDVVIVQFGDLYIQYNRAEALNIQVLEKKDQLVITRANADTTSESMAGLSAGSVYYNSTYKIEFCSKTTDSVGRDYAVVQISVITDDVSCVPPTPTPKPSRAPTSQPFSLLTKDRSCYDNMVDSFFVTETKEWRRCMWLWSRPDKKRIYCSSFHPSGAYDLCQKSCGKCGNQRLP